MKSLIYSFALLLVSFTGWAQIDRSVRPEPSEARAPKIAEYTSFELKNGLKVFVVQDKKLPRVSIQLLLHNDPIFEGEKAGYVEVTGDILKTGTANRTKEQLDDEIEFMGATISTSGNGAYASSLSKYTETVMELLADIVLNPAFNEEEFEKIIKRYESGLESEKDNPNSIASKVSSKLLFGDKHPYGESMTEETLKNIKVEDLRKYYNTYFKPNRAYIAIVGDIKPKKAKKLVKKYFGKWEKGEVPSHEYKEPTLSKEAFIALINRDASVQSVISVNNITTNKIGNPDAEAIAVANQILGGGFMGRLFKNLREDKGYTYGAYSRIGSDRLTATFYAGADVRNEVTDSALVQLLHELDSITKHPISEEELKSAKSYLAGSFGRSLESPNTVSRFALNIARYDLPRDYYNNYLKRLDAVTIEDVQRVVREHIKPENLVITIVGRASDIAPGLGEVANVKYYDIKGNPTDPPSLPLPEGVTAESVLNNYFKAIGGIEKAKSVKGMNMEAKMEMKGMPAAIVITRKTMAPDKMLEKVEVPNMMVFSERKLNGNKAFMSQQGREIEVDEEMMKDMKSEASNPIDELKYLNKEKYTLKAKHMGMMEGKKVYVVDVNADGKSAGTLYFDAESGLLLREEKTEEGPEGPMVTSTTYTDFKEVDGLKVPVKMVQSAGGQTFSITVEKIEINPKFEKGTFNL